MRFPCPSACTVLAVAGCAADLPDPPRARSSTVVRAESGEDLASLPPVVRLRVAHAGLAATDGFGLFAGTLGDYHLRRVAQDDIPSTLEALRVPVVAWNDPDTGESVVAPSRRLEPGAYTLAASGIGFVAFLQVAPQLETVPFLERVFPPPGEIASAARWFYCGEEAPRNDPPPSTLFEPGELPVAVAVEPIEGCLRFEPLEPLRAGSRVVAPALLGERFLDPAPLFIGAVAPASSMPCPEPSIAFGAGCASVEDDRIVVDSGPDTTLWVVRGAPESPVQLRVTRPGERWAIRGLQPSTDVELSVETYERGGARRELVVTIHTAPSRVHVVLNEVLANARGVEPAAEWIEVVNDGASTVDLEGFELADVGGVATLPRAVLAPGAFALVVREDYEPDPELDVPPSSDTQLVRVAALGKAGLSNAGERIELRDPLGKVVSRFAAVPAPHPGVSVARRAPDAVDGDRDAFAAHADPGASPGSKNMVQGEGQAVDRP
jgi:hypothetical protein